MAYAQAFVAREPSRADVEAMPGEVLLEFGAPWCGHCIAAAPIAEHLLTVRDQVRHLRIEDGRGRPLGRSFAVKLWPTFVLLRDGVEQARAVRPRSLDALEALFDTDDADDADDTNDTNDANDANDANEANDAAGKADPAR